MNINKKERIQLLLDKYIAGETTNSEEKTLRKFFATHRNGIPTEWQPYRALFGFVEMERSGKKARKRTLKIISFVSVAATLLLLFSLSLGRKQSSECYMIIDGKKYTDKKEVRAEAIEALQMVGENNDDDPFSAMKMMR